MATWLQEQLVSSFSELLQDDLITRLDGHPKELVDSVCQIVIDRTAEFRKALQRTLETSQILDPPASTMFVPKTQEVYDGLDLSNV